MAKLLIEIELDEKDIPKKLEPCELSDLLYQMGYLQVEWNFSATVTDDAGEIIRESE